VNVKKTISGFKSIGYTSDSLDDDTLGFYKNYWYQEFRDLLFLFKGDAAAEYLTKNIEKVDSLNNLVESPPKHIVSSVNTMNLSNQSGDKELFSGVKTKENTMNLLNQSGNKELFSGERSSKENNHENIDKSIVLKGGNNEPKINSSLENVNPFMKTIKTNKFIKNKHFGNNISKNTSSFYKKKYEENFAHYNSLTEDIKDTEKSHLDSLPIKENVQNSLKIIKNKIMLTEASSDEESDNEELNLQ
jgi:RNA binding exosome subunit